MKKGQAALEYLVTYGWGFIVILAVLGALAYFGFLNPTRYIPSHCDFGAQLICVDYQLRANDDPIHNGNVTLIFRNNFGDEITVEELYIDNVMITDIHPIDPSIKKGANSVAIMAQLTDTSPVFLIKGDRTTVPIVVQFRRTNPGNSPSHNISGEIFAPVN